jgi:hypothetical protein
VRRTPIGQGWEEGSRGFNSKTSHQPSTELAVTTGGGMPEQVAIGYIRAEHRANGGRRDDGVTLNLPSSRSGTL